MSGMSEEVLISRASFGGGTVDALIRGGRFAEMSETPIQAPSARVVDARGKILAPAFYNGHTHAAMNLLRGYADDLELMDWLQNHIWPAEAHLDDAIVYAGTRLSILEMIKSGTVFFNDMYWYAPAVLRAAENMKVRAAIARQAIELSPGVNNPTNVESNAKLESDIASCSDRVFLTYAPHAIYTVCGDSLREMHDKAVAEKSYYHMHVAETRFEVETCMKQHGGMTPVEYLDSLGVLDERTVMAHCVHLTDNDIRIIRERGAVIVHNAQSNLKLDSGFFQFKRAVEDGGCRTILGTDGCCSNNSMSMFSEMKTAALLAKTVANDPRCAKADLVWRMATRGGAEAFGLDAGEIAVGKLADCMLLDGGSSFLVPGFNRASDFVYSADSSCVDTVICGGNVLMENRVVPGEAEIIAEAREAAAKLVRG